MNNPQSSPQGSHQSIVEALLDDVQLTLDELARAARVSPAWVIERAQAGLLVEIDPIGAEPATWRFGTVTLQRVRRMARLERDFDAAPELAALVADLQEEIAALRAELARNPARIPPRTPPG
jgi:chaperone modulatory protein CbpM